MIIPKLTKEVNSSKRYASLRQVFFSLVMARWFKDTFKDKSGQYSKLIDSHNLNELTSKEAWDKTYYFNEYKKSFEKGEYNLKEQIHTPAGQMIRSYVSGGLSIGMSSAMEDNHLKGVYSGKNNNKHLVSISTGFLREPGDRNSMFYFSGKTIDGGKIKYFISSAKNGDIEIIDGKSGSALVKNDDDYKNGRKHYPALTITTEPMGNFLDFDFTPYEMKPVKDFSDRLKKSTNPEYILKDIRKWIGGNASKKAVEQATREIMGVVIPYLANEKASVATEAAAIIKDIINYERPAQAMLSLAVGPGLRFLEDRHIEMIADLIRDGIASSEPYLASEALGVILFMAAESKIESRRIDGLSSIRKLADLLLGKLQSHQEIIAQFLKQVERAGAINIDQEKTGLGIAKAVEGAQKSLIALQKSMRGFGSPMIEARPAEDADLILYKQKQKKSLEKNYGL